MHRPGLPQKGVLFGSREFREASQHTYCVAVERLDQGSGYAMEAPVFFTIAIAGIVECDKWIPSDVEQPTMVLSENPLR